MNALKGMRLALKSLMMLALLLGIMTTNPSDAHAVEVKVCPPERIGAPAKEEDARLSVFTELLGTWKGHGYNLIPLPVNGSSPDEARFEDVFRVEAQSYEDEITFDLVGCVPNRGNAQPDQFAKAIAYQQTVTVNKGGIVVPIHEENGMLLVLEPDASTAPDQFTVARLASVPHGDAILAMGQHAKMTRSAPKFPILDSRPINNDNGKPDDNPAYLKPYIEANQSLELTPEEIQNPNLLLEHFVEEQATQGRVITQTAKVELSTKNDGYIANIPFLSNAETSLDVPGLDFTIWIEQVEDSNGQKSAQLQYSQNSLLDFQGFIWPHIDVSSLTKQ